jgi:hypothetical protein
MGAVMLGGQWRPLADAERLLDVMARTYKRDKDGKFGSGSGGGEVREALTQARTTAELNEAIKSEARRITGHELRVDLKGADLDTAKEYGEGILQGLERFPDAPLAYVHTYGPGGARPDVGADFSGAYAITQHGYITDAIGFNASSPHASDAAQLRAQLAGLESRGWLTSGTPAGVALHEFGHVVAYHTGTEGPAYRIAHSSAKDAAGAPLVSGGITRHIRGHVSDYASTNRMELAAEAFADVMTHGHAAKPLSKDIFGAIETGYSDAFGAPSARLLARTYKRDKDGRFGSGGGGVRGALAVASTIEAVNQATVSEVRRITGRSDVVVDMAGSDLQVARRSPT